MNLKTVISIAISTMIMTCLSAQQKDASVFYVGTYTGGGSEGIYKYAMNPDGTLDSIGLAAKTSNPSFLAITDDGQFLLSVSEVSGKSKSGVVQSYRIGPDGLEFISESSSGGAHPCFVGVNEEGYVAVANYTGGNVALYRIDEKGVLSEPLDVQQHEGSDITDRQKGPHAHSAWFDPVNGNLIAVDLGTNDLWIYGIDTDAGKLVPADPPILSMEPGAGPRHLDFHPNGKWIYVLNELNGTVSLVTRKGSDQYQLEDTYSTLPADFDGFNKSADIHISDDGRFLYASNRGPENLAIFEVNKKNGTLTPSGHASVHGKTPRNFSISPCGKFVLVANQDSGNIGSFKRDKKTGQLTKIDEINAPKPVCVRFY